MTKLRWTVQAAPAGNYRSFFRRGWPSATLGETMAFTVSCEDEYVPSRVRTGDHKELTLRIADHRKADGSFDWRSFKTKFATMDELKAHAQQFADTHPEFFVKEQAS